MHGGCLMALADSVGAMCAFLNLPEGAGTSTIESKTNFFRALTAGNATITSTLVHAGRRTIVVQTAKLPTISLERSIEMDGRIQAAIMASPDRTPGLRQLDVPTLVIHGLMDKLVRPSGGTATAAAVPGSRLLVFPDMGHDLPEPRHPEIVEAIRRHADRAR